MANYRIINGKSVLTKVTEQYVSNGTFKKTDPTAFNECTALELILVNGCEQEVAAVKQLLPERLQSMVCEKKEGLSLLRNRALSLTNALMGKNKTQLPVNNLQYNPATLLKNSLNDCACLVLNYAYTKKEQFAILCMSFGLHGIQTKTSLDTAVSKTTPYLLRINLFAKNYQEALNQHLSPSPQMKTRKKEEMPPLAHPTN